MFGIIWLVIRRKKYLVLTAATALVIFVLSYFLTIWAITGKSIVAYIDMSSWAFTLFSLFLSLVIAILFGVYLSLSLVRRRLMKEREISARGGSARSPRRAGGKNKLCSASGAAVGLFASGCPTCGAPLFALFGAPLALFSLPFRGLELKVLSIALLVLSIYLLVENIQKQLFCKVETKIL